MESMTASLETRRERMSVSRQRPSQHADDALTITGEFVSGKAWEHKEAPLVGRHAPVLLRYA